MTVEFSTLIDFLQLFGFIYSVMFFLLCLVKVYDPNFSLYLFLHLPMGKRYEARFDGNFGGWPRFWWSFKNFVLLLGFAAVGICCFVWMVPLVPRWWAIGTAFGMANTVIAGTLLLTFLYLLWVGIRLVGERRYTIADLAEEAEAARAREERRQSEKAELAYREQREEERRREEKRLALDQRRSQRNEILGGIGLGPILNEPESPMSRYYVPEAPTDIYDPLAPFWGKFSPLSDPNLLVLLEQTGVVQFDPEMTIDVEGPDLFEDDEFDDGDDPGLERAPQLDALAGIRDEAVVLPSTDVWTDVELDDADMAADIAQVLWAKLRTQWRNVIDSPAAKAMGEVSPATGRYIPEQFVLPEALLEVTLGGRPPRLTLWRYKGETVPGMLVFDLETASRYPGLYAWLRVPENRDRLLDLDTERDEIEALSSVVTAENLDFAEGPVGGWRPPTLALTEAAWTEAIGFVPDGEVAPSRQFKEHLCKVILPIDW